jgi:hypothetical protein
MGGIYASQEAGWVPAQRKVSPCKEAGWVPARPLNCAVDRKCVFRYKKSGRAGAREYP